jgi:hypothetical protein
MRWLAQAHCPREETEAAARTEEQVRPSIGPIRSRSALAETTGDAVCARARARGVCLRVCARERV